VPDKKYILELSEDEVNALGELLSLYYSQNMAKRYSMQNVAKHIDSITEVLS
jgi:hypothetical protein